MLKIETDLYDSDDLSARHREHRVLGGGELEERVVELAAGGDGGRGPGGDARGGAAARRRRRHRRAGAAVDLLVDRAQVRRSLQRGGENRKCFQSTDKVFLVQGDPTDW